MEDRRANIVAASLIVALLILIIVSRALLHLSRTFFLICGASNAAIVGVVLYLILRRRFNQRRILLETQYVSESRELRIEYSFLRKVAGVPTKYRYKELEEATDRFQALIGQGASASVFKGILNDGTAVAVKRINSGEERGDKEFRSEVAAIASVQHLNLVRLLGYCMVTGGPKFLIYEFIPNGSLDKWIFRKSNHRNSINRIGGCLFWHLRYRVAIDVAKALAYLHQDCRSRILHLDVKPENILLDENYRAIVSDFGLSRLMGWDESRIISSVRGTRGYIAPEWLLGNGVSERSDIYSYGMVLLELVGGRRNISTISHHGDKSKNKLQYFPKIVNEKMREGKLMEIVDERLLEHGGVDEREVKTLVYVAFWCIQERTRLRPSMKQVVDMLEGRTVVDEPPETKLLLVDLLSIDDQPERNHVRPTLATFSSNVESIPPMSSCSIGLSVLTGR